MGRNAMTSIRNALVGAMLAVSLMAAAMVTALGIWSLGRNVLREAQARVTHDLNIVQSQYERQLEAMAERLEQEAATLSLTEESPALFLSEIQQRLGLTVLNLCDVEGKPLAGGYPEAETQAPVLRDPVLRQASQGTPAWGTLRLDAERLEREGGAALRNSAVIPTPEANGSPASTAALFWWAACPVRDANGRITSLLYGGRMLNANFALVDEMRLSVFGDEQYKGKPMGTVTFFLDEVRIATNVLGPDRHRAIGTSASREVQQRVLDQARPWLDRAWVVDEWYVSGYQPLQDPEGSVVGMLYVGLLEAPYRALKTQLVLNIMGPVLGVLLLAVGGGLYLVRRITSPVHQLSQAALQLSRGHWDYPIEVSGAFREIDHLGRTFQDMQQAIAERDRQLRRQNQTLEEANERLERANRNYMHMLGFVTHELKSPLAAMQSLILVLTGGLAGEVSDQAKGFLVRIQRNCEELQDMVKNYLDLSRVERGELEANKTDIDFYSEVVEPAVSQSAQLFDSRRIALDVHCTEGLGIHADADLLRIALVNFLTNAAKYGREGGSARLEVRREEQTITASVWNEGEGFTPEEGEQLFKKFSRLSNPNTRDKRGSGLGLFLCKQIIDLHGGRVWAESEPGRWARFSFSLLFLLR